MPSEASVRKWCDDDPALDESYDRAVRHRARSRMRILEQLGKKHESNQLTAVDLKVQLELQRYLQSKEDPSRYSDRPVAAEQAKPAAVLNNEDRQQKARRMALVLAMGRIKLPGAPKPPPPAATPEGSDDNGK